MNQRQLPQDESVVTSKGESESKKKSNFWVNASAQTSNKQGRINQNIFVEGYHEFVIENQSNKDQWYELRVNLCLSALSFCFNETKKFIAGANSTHVGTTNSGFPFSTRYAGNYTLTATTDLSGAEQAHGEAKAMVYVR